MATEGRVTGSGQVSTQKNVPEAGSLDSGGDLMIRAALKDGDLRVTITATVPYGGRSVSVTHEVKGNAEIKAALEAIAEGQGDAVLRDGRREAARAMLVAMDKGEDV